MIYPSSGSSNNTESAHAAEVTAAATGIFQRLLPTASASVGFPRTNTSRIAIEEGVRLNYAFLEIDNPRVRALVTELARAIADLTKAR